MVPENGDSEPKLEAFPTVSAFEGLKWLRATVSSTVSTLQGQRLCATVKTRGTVWTVQTQACLEGLCLVQRAAVPFAVAGHVTLGWLPSMTSRVPKPFELCGCGRNCGTTVLKEAVDEANRVASERQRHRSSRTGQHNIGGSPCVCS